MFRTACGNLCHIHINKQKPLNVKDTWWFDRPIEKRCASIACKTHAQISASRLFLYSHTCHQASVRQRLECAKTHFIMNNNNMQLLIKLSLFFDNFNRFKCYLINQHVVWVEFIIVLSIDHQVRTVNPTAMPDGNGCVIAFISGLAQFSRWVRLPLPAWPPDHPSLQVLEF